MMRGGMSDGYDGGFVDGRQTLGPGNLVMVGRLPRNEDPQCPPWRLRLATATASA